MANKPNNPKLWSQAKSMAKQKFDVYPSAYSNGWAAKWYKSKGGTWRKAMYGMQVPMMEQGGKPEWLVEAQLKAQGYSGNALQQKMNSMAQGGEPNNEGFQALPEYVQEKIMSNMAFGGYLPEMFFGGKMKRNLEQAAPMLLKFAPMLFGAPPIMQKGGQATSADSLKVYNNAVNLMNYYKNDGRHFAPQIDEYTGNISRAHISYVGEQNLEKYREMLDYLLNPDKPISKFRIAQYKKDYGLPIPELVKRVSQAIRESKSAQPGTAYYKDAFPSKIDINSPSAFVDSRIDPQGFVYFKSSVKDSSVSPEPAGSVTGTWYYDPIAVKPAAMRTAKEQAEFDKKYGQKKSTISRKSTPPVVKRDPPQRATVDNSRTRPSMGNPGVPQLSPNALTQNNMNKSRAVDFWNPSMSGGVQGGWHRRLFGSMEEADNFMKFIRENNLSSGYDVTNSGVNTDADRVQYGYGGSYSMMQQGGEPDGGMALGQIAAVVDKMSKLAQMIGPNSDLEPWISSKLSVMDHYADAVSDYMMYNPEAQGDMQQQPQGLPMPEMKNGGGIPERYKNMGFTKVGVKKESTRPGKKWMVLAQKGNQYKVVHGGYDGMKDYTQHGSEKRRDRFWDRMGGKNSAKANDPFSPLYWHKRFGTWEDGGQMPEMKSGGSTFSGNAWYDMGGGYIPEFMGGMMYQEGGPVEGDVMDVTPEQLEMLKAQGYQFEIL